jgi:TetR/AcrR family transcriptional regulator
MVKSTRKSSRDNNLERAADASTRARILQAGLEAFAARGFDGATTRMIADSAGVNVGLIKYYFDSKERLWQESADQAFAGVEAAMGDVLSDLGDLAPIDRVRVMVRRFVRFVARKPESARLLLDAGTRDSHRMRWLVDRHQRALYAQLKDVISSLQKEGVLPSGIDPLHFFYLLVGAVSVLFHQAPECLYLTGVDPRDAEVADAHADALIAITLAGASERPSRKPNMKRR